MPACSRRYGASKPRTMQRRSEKKSWSRSCRVAGDASSAVDRPARSSLPGAVSRDTRWSASLRYGAFGSAPDAAAAQRSLPHRRQAAAAAAAAAAALPVSSCLVLALAVGITDPPPPRRAAAQRAPPHGSAAVQAAVSGHSPILAVVRSWRRSPKTPLTPKK